MSKAFMHKTLARFAQSPQQSDESFESLVKEQQKWYYSLSINERIGYDAAVFVNQVKTNMEEENVAFYNVYSPFQVENQLVLSELSKLFLISPIFVDGQLVWKVARK